MLDIFRFGGGDKIGIRELGIEFPSTSRKALSEDDESTWAAVESQTLSLSLSLSLSLVCLCTCVDMCSGEGRTRKEVVSRAIHPTRVSCLTVHDMYALSTGD